MKAGGYKIHHIETQPRKVIMKDFKTALKQECKIKGKLTMAAEVVALFALLGASYGALLLIAAYGG